MEEYDVFRCVDKGLEPFGSHVKETLYWRITILHDSLHYCVIENPEVFVRVIRELFGEGARVFERSIMKELRHAFELSERDDLTAALLSVREQIAAASYRNDNHANHIY